MSEEASRDPDAHEVVVVCSQPTKEKKVIGRPKPSRSFSCCSPASEGTKVELCPKAWFAGCCCCCSHPEANDIDETHYGPPAGDIPCRARLSCLDVCWKVCFVSVCLPFCYTCYLTRTIRRRSRGHLSTFLTSSKQEETVVKANDSMSATLLQQVSEPRRKEPQVSPGLTRKTPSTGARADGLPTLEKIPSGEEEEAASEEPLLNSSDIHINAIVLNSTSGQLLLPHLSAKPSLGIRGSVESAAIDRKATRFPLPRIDEEAYHVPLLRGNAEGDGSSGSSKQTGLRRSRASKRWSKMITFGRAASRFSKRSENADGDAISISNDHKDMKSKQSQTSYYSFVSDVDEREEEDRPGLMEISPLGMRTHKVAGRQMSFHTFDEDSVAEWRGLNLRDASRIPNVDVLVIGIEKGNLDELSSVLHSERGILHYVFKFWSGFYPLLLVELTTSEENPDDEEYDSKTANLCRRFADVHRVQIPSRRVAENAEWLLECAGRLFIHSRLFQCSRFFGKRTDALNECPGGCDLPRSGRSLLEEGQQKKKSIEAIGGTATSSSIKKLHVHQAEGTNIHALRIHEALLPLHYCASQP